MSKTRIPASVATPAAILGLFVLELLFRYGRRTLDLVEIGAGRDAGAIALLWAIAACSIGITVTSIVLLCKGFRGGAVLTTLLCIWELTGVAAIGDLLSWVLALLAVVAVVAVWLPTSRQFVASRRAVRQATSSDA